MSARIWLSSAALSTFAIFTVVSAAPSAALTAKECSAKYKAAKTAGTLKGETWNEFRIKYAQELNQQPNPSPHKSHQALHLQTQQLRQVQCFPRVWMQSTPRSPQVRPAFIRVSINTERTRKRTAMVD